jgi:hypothetical protein
VDFESSGVCRFRHAGGKKSEATKSKAKLKGF